MTTNSEDIRATIRNVSVSEGATIRDAMQAINSGALGVALVTDREGKFRALLTDGDIRRALLAGKGMDTLAITVANTNAVVVRQQEAAIRTPQLLSERSRFIPVLDDEGSVVEIAYFDKRTRLPMVEPIFGETEIAYVNECILSGWVSSTGKYVTRFEETFAAFCGAKHAVAVCNGTCALHVAMLGLGIGPGDEVIVPSLSFIASGNTVVHAGARPVFADSDIATWNIDPAAIEPLITKRTRAIMPVHLYGHPANMAKITAIARRHGLAVIEDAAEAHGARCNGQRVGSLGDVACFSFFGNKIITTGEGGMVVTNDTALADRIRLLRDHGMSRERKYFHPVIGYNYRLTNIQAALGVAQMERIDGILQTRREAADFYRSELGHLPGIVLPPEEPWAENIFWLYSILVDESAAGISRDALLLQLQTKGVETRPFFIPMHQQPPYAQPRIHLPVCERLSAIGINLPMPSRPQPKLLQRVVDEIKDAFARANAPGGPRA